MEEKKEIRKKIFKARKEHSDEWIQKKKPRDHRDADSSS